MSFDSLDRLEAVNGDSPRAQLVAQLFKEHNAALVRFLAARLHSEQDAREIAQEAYVKLLSLDKPGAISFLRAFLFKIAANLAVDRQRSRGRFERLVAAGFLDELREVPTPDRELASAQQLAIVHRLVSELPARCRRAFLLHRIYGQDITSISRQIGVTERMVRNYIVRASLHCVEGLRGVDEMRGRSCE